MTDDAAHTCFPVPLRRKNTTSEVPATRFFSSLDESVEQFDAEYKKAVALLRVKEKCRDDVMSWVRQKVPVTVDPETTCITEDEKNLIHCRNEERAAASQAAIQKLDAQRKAGYASHTSSDVSSDSDTPQLVQDSHDTVGTVESYLVKKRYKADKKKRNNELALQAIEALKQEALRGKTRDIEDRNMGILIRGCENVRGARQRWRERRQAAAPQKEQNHKKDEVSARQHEARHHMQEDSRLWDECFKREMQRVKSDMKSKKEEERIAKIMKTKPVFSPLASPTTRRAQREQAQNEPMASPSPSTASSSLSASCSSSVAKLMQRRDDEDYEQYLRAEALRRARDAVLSADVGFVDKQAKLCFQF